MRETCHCAKGPLKSKAQGRASPDGPLPWNINTDTLLSLFHISQLSQTMNSSSWCAIDKKFPVSKEFPCKHWVFPQTLCQRMPKQKLLKIKRAHKKGTVDIKAKDILHYSLNEMVQHTNKALFDHRLAYKRAQLYSECWSGGFFLRVKMKWERHRMSLLWDSRSCHVCAWRHLSFQSWTALQHCQPRPAPGTGTLSFPILLAGPWALWRTHLMCSNTTRSLPLHSLPF